MNAALPSFDLTGKTALITGAGGLLGVQHAIALLECGARVILTDVHEDSMASAEALIANEQPSGDVLHYEMDITCSEQIENVSARLEREGIAVDILVNNAAIDPKVSKDSGIKETSRLENFPLEQWDLQIAVGLTGAFLCAKIFGSQMASNGNGGVILNIASDLSVFSPDQRLYRKEGVPEDNQPVKPVTYSVIKTGLVGLTRYLATYWAEKNIRCNALSPGGVYNGQGEEFVQKLTSLIPCGRMAAKDEYRAAVQFLCSDASRYMNGQNIVMDGGRSVW